MNFVDSFLKGYEEAITAPKDHGGRLHTPSHGTSELGEGSQQQVLTDSAAAFGDVDATMLLMSYGDTQSAEAQQVARQGMEEIQPILRSLTWRQAYDILNKPKMIGRFLSTFRRAPQAPNTDMDHSKSLLNAEELLKERIRDCLQFFLSGLNKQLDGCDLHDKRKHYHLASLHLTGFRNQFDERNRLFFDFYLSTRLDWTPCRWQQSRCIIQGTVEEMEKPGCGMIQDCERLKVQLGVLLEEKADGHLRREHDGSPCRVSNAVPTISLHNLLDDGSLRQFSSPNHKYYILPLNRAKLRLNLALSLLHLSQNEWRQIAWDADSIFFLKDPTSGNLQDEIQPYLSWAIKPSVAIPDTESDEPSCDFHLLQFARLLMEIHAGQRVDAREKGRCLQDRLLKTISNTQLYLTPQDDMFVAAVKACLSSEGKMAAQRNSGPDNIRDFIFRHIVLNLESHVIISESPIQDPNLFHSRELSPTSGTNVSPFDSASYNEPNSLEASKNSRIFFSFMRNWLYRYIEPLRDQHPDNSKKYLQQKIKIAVIDSGARFSDDRIRDARAGGKIKDGRNFLPSASPSDWNDSLGHGTIVASLLLDLAPNAEVYVAKVTEGQTIDANNLYCVGEAINWAIQEWQVDIISMSLVLHEENDDIEEQLAQAIDPSYEGPGVSRKIVFAAAGNSGGNVPTGWPARRKGVIAIHATDGQGNYMGINPNPNLQGSNFATLGCDIETEWTSEGEVDEKRIYVTGTSYATPIAAAIAANVLEFSRHKLHLTKDRKRRLYTGACIASIFKEMMGNRGGYNYVQPWTLWDHGNVEHKDVCKILLDVISGVY